MTALSTLRFKIHRLLLSLLAKIIRPVVIALAHLSRTPKPTPDSIEYVPINTNSTTDHKIRLHIYNPFSTTNDEPQAPSPVLINACGSGFVILGHGTDIEYCRYMATRTCHTVIDVAYRLAPELFFPAALEYIAAVVSHVRSQPDRYDSTRISIGGFSAGGNLATSVAVNYFPLGSFKNLITFYPVLDASIPGPTKIANMPAEVSGRPKYGGMGSVPALAMRFFQACYVSSTKDELAEKGLSDPRISPGHADLDRFPGRCLFVTAECNCLAAEVEELARRLKEERTKREEEEEEEEEVVVVVVKVSGCGHAFDKRAEVGSEREKVKMETYGIVARFLNQNQI